MVKENEHYPEETDSITIFARLRLVRQLEPRFLQVVIDSIPQLPAVQVSSKNSGVSSLPALLAAVFVCLIAILFLPMPL